MFTPIYLKILFHNKPFDVLFLTKRNYMVIKTKTAIKTNTKQLLVRAVTNYDTYSNIACLYLQAGDIFGGLL